MQILADSCAKISNVASCSSPLDKLKVQEGKLTCAHEA